MNDYYGDAKVHCKVVISDPEYSENEAESEPSHEWYPPLVSSLLYSASSLNVLSRKHLLTNHFIQILDSLSTSGRIQPKTTVWS